MTLEEAIEFQEQYLRQPQTHIGDILDDAIRLGIEALKRCRHNYLNPQRADFRRLPGETEGET